MGLDMSNGFDRQEHEAMVREFMNQKKMEDEERYEEVCEMFPVQTYPQQRLSRNRELTVGLLGLSPSRISPRVASKNSVESSVFDDFDS